MNRTTVAEHRRAHERTKWDRPSSRKPQALRPIAETEQLSGPAATHVAQGRFVETAFGEVGQVPLELLSRSEWVGVPHPWLDVEFSIDSDPSRTFGESRGVVQKHLVGPDLYQQGRQSSVIGKEW